MIKIQWRRFNERVDDSNPTLELCVEAAGDRATLRLEWRIGLGDASCWKRPLGMSISPEMPSVPDGMDPQEWRDALAQETWETDLSLTREDMRLVRDFLTSLLASPDLRDEG